MTSGVVRTVVVVVGVVVVLLTALWFFQRRLIYLPDTTPAPPAGHVIPGAEDVVLVTSDDLELGAWHVPARAQPRAVTVLVANGNAGHRAGRALFADALARTGFDVLLFDYRGYGGNPGRPSEEGLARDVRAAYAYLVEERLVPPEQILYFGESLGAAVVVDLATSRPPAGLLLRSPFTSLADVGKVHYRILPVGLLLRDEYPVAESISEITVPTTVVYGGADRIVPPELSREVAAAAAGQVQLVAIAGAGHNDAAMFTGVELIGALVDLAERAVEH
jgi:fermentation-respiration switch protein FrsA (DUF1100 family)